MDTPPSFITLELDEHDVARDIEDIVTAMDQIRIEQRIREEMSDGAKEEYFHLAFRLASGIQAVADDKAVDLFQTVVDCVGKNPPLLGYEYAQDELWREYNPVFSRSMDEVLIRVLGDGFRGLQDKHHLFNAIKYLASTTGDEDAKKLQQDIHPFFSPYSEHSSAAFKKRFRGQFGWRFQNLIEGDALHVSPEFIENSLETARRFGFASVKTKIPPKNYEKLSETYPIRVLETGEKELSVEIPVKREEGCCLSNYHPIMEELAQYPLPEDVERNLVWSVENHHTFGDEFESALLVDVERKGFGKWVYSNRNEELVALYNSENAGLYQKLSVLLCYFGKRTAITMISPANGSDEDQHISPFNNLAGSESSLQEEQLEKIMEDTGAIHLHISRFNQLEKVADYTLQSS